MAVLRNFFALLVSVDVIYCQHTRKSYLTSTETKRQLWDKKREVSEKKVSVDVSVLTIDDIDRNQQRKKVSQNSHKPCIP